jgi:hypothetical protein
MKYNLYYDSYDLNRKNVLVYGKEKLVLFSFDFLIAPSVCFSDDIIIDDNFNIDSLLKENFICKYYCDVKIDKNDENIIEFINEHQEIFNVYRQFYDDIDKISYMISDIYDLFGDSSLRTEEEFLSKKNEIDEFFNNYLNSFKEKYNMLFEQVDNEYVIPDSTISINNFIEEFKMNQEKIIEEALTSTILEEEENTDEQTIEEPNI